jgi:light-regulated signal transduction histidine kinase (bacteriophytochrome)
MSGRQVFDTPRAAEFLELRALQSQTGQHADRFGDVVVKELLDNALDAAESAGTAPEVEMAVAVRGDVQLVTVTDNGPGLPAEVVERILDFNVLVSDKAAYRSPTRGAQGNAFKTLLGIPGVRAEVEREGCGMTTYRRRLAVRDGHYAVLDPDGRLAFRLAGSGIARDGLLPAVGCARRGVPIRWR